MYGDQMVRMLRAVDMLCTATGVTKRGNGREALEVDKRTVDRLLGVLTSPTVAPLSQPAHSGPVRNLLISIAV